MSLDEYRDNLLSVTFTFDQLVYIINALEDLAQEDKKLDNIMNVFDNVEVVEIQSVH